MQEILFGADIKAVRYWLTTNPVAKLIVAAGFMTVFAGTDLLIYSGIRHLFLVMTNTGIFGNLTAQYVIHATVVILLWFITGSTIFSTLMTFLKRSPNTEYLITQPVSPEVIVHHRLNTALFTTVILTTGFLLPAILAYTQVFPREGTNTIASAAITILTIALITQATGTALALGILEVAGSSAKKSMWYATVVFILGGGAVFGLVNPPQMQTLATITDQAEFARIYQTLPLVNPLNPIIYPAETIVNGAGIGIFILAIGARLILSGVSGWYSNGLINLHQKLQENRLGQRNSGLPKVTGTFDRVLLSTRFPLSVKDWLSILRFPQETGYALFLGILCLIFLVTVTGLSNKYGSMLFSAREIYTFVYASIMFFGMAYLLRFIFPLVAREGSSAWYFFTQPLTQDRMLTEKLLTGIFVSVPYLVFMMAAWLLTDIARPVFFSLAVISLFSWLGLTCDVLLMGAIRPNFPDARDSEKISTSSMGLATVALAIVIVAVNGKLILASGSIPTLPYLWTSFALNGMITVILYLILRGQKPYQF